MSRTAFLLWHTTLTRNSNISRANIFIPFPYTLKALKYDNILTKPDKGRRVILNRVDYFNKLQTIFNDTSKFKPFMSDTATHLLGLEDKENTYAR